jgi:uncharacterized protein YndB with AHSA1/START domain
MIPLALAAASLLNGAAHAEVISAIETGFALTRVVTINKPPAAVYAALGRPATWWDSGHSWSGDAKNMTLNLRVGGCFCESLPATRGGVEHGRVVFASPGKQLRLQAALGPLQAEAVTGTLTWTLKPVDGGTEVTNTYVVGGMMRGGGTKWAPVVDSVVGVQLDRLKAMLERPRA